jgi:DNA mismatch endonuclease (patch repair protein)
MDVLTPSQRHTNMSAIRSKDTRPELIVRHWLWSHGFRYRLNDPRLPGHPDLVLRKYRTCIFVNGCFWHGHEGCKYFQLPQTNTEFWQKKISRNKQRDIEEQRQLAKMGWHCITVWECELKKDRRQQTLENLVFTLNHIFLNDRSIRYDHLDEEKNDEMAAEPLPEQK